MEYFEVNILQKPVFDKEGTIKWLIDKAFTAQKKQLKAPFTKSEFEKTPNKYLHFGKLSKDFECANPKCKSTNVICIWYLYQPIDMRVDETFAEFYCPDCKKYTLVEYYRDDS